SLQKIDKKTGNISGAEILYRVQLQNAGGGFKLIGDYKISGKTNTQYQQALMFQLPHGGPWDIRLTRLTADSTVVELQNDLYWDSYTELIDDRVNYTLSACVGFQINAEQFRTIPKRTYLVDGLLVRIPSNYDPYKRTYTGAWDGRFKIEWTSN